MKFVFLRRLLSRFHHLRQILTTCTKYNEFLNLARVLEDLRVVSRDLCTCVFLFVIALNVISLR